MTASHPVNHPSHYTSGPTHSVCGEPIECIDITETLGFCLGNAIKYVWRSDLKGSRLQDLEKARWYIDREIARLQGEPRTTRDAVDALCPEPPCKQSHWERKA